MVTKEEMMRARIHYQEMNMFDRFLIIVTYYYWLVHHHNGQWSEEYKRFCKIQKYFNPGPLSSTPANVEFEEGYKILCQRNGCTHN